ncbi:hypothetical protein [uncultured Methanomethylovorans sp.]|uniref:hypothetical protein n=1 Tax=uncultured Methanomethylovorans sp. TaxID=183759 RepID=UPI002AA8C564|nr:hypothetical protein [uncultured Methanomethylovorans sp.]
MTSDTPFYDCPHYRACKVQNCPLSPYYGNSQKSQRCKLEKDHRKRIAALYPDVLKYGGLTKAEYEKLGHEGDEQ